MKNKKVFIITLLLLLILVYVYFSIFTDNFDGNLIANYVVLIVIALLGIYFISLVCKNLKSNNFKFRDKLFKRLAENTNTIYIMMDSKTNKVLYLSDNVESLLGIKSKDKLDEKTVFEIFNLPVIKSELNNWDKTQEYVSQMVEYDNHLYNHDMWIRIKILPIKDKAQEYYIIQIIDATKEHDKQHLLVTQATDIKARESQLNQITATSYDMEMNINLMSNTFDLKYFKKDNLYFGEEKRGIYSESLKDIVNTYINENDKKLVYDNFSIEKLKEHFSKYELDSISVRYRIGNEVKNNTWLESSIFFLSNRQNNKVSILTKNVTENAESIREQNILLQNALNEAKMADKAKTKLISTISHDIRTPLTNVIGLSDSLLSKDLKYEVKEDVENIKTSSEEVLDIIDDLLDTSNIEKKLIEKEEKQYSILKMFKALDFNAKEYIGNKPIKFNLNLDSNLPVILMGDYKRITQALTQIINNAIKYTEEGCINIFVRGEKKDAMVKLIIEISDTGVGIEASKLDAIIKSKDSNTGIGTVKKLIGLLDGTLEIESKINEYTKVIISFNQKIVEDNKIREMINNNKNAENFDLKGKKILVVDDNKLNLKVTSRLLEPYNVDVTLLESGNECIDIIAAQNDFDLILLDQMMPGMDGITTLNNLKLIKNFNIPVVVLTADAMEGQKNKYLSNGFSDYISKPIDRGELSRVLKKFLKDHE